MKMKTLSCKKTNKQEINSNKSYYIKTNKIMIQNLETHSLSNQTSSFRSSKIKKHKFE